MKAASKTAFHSIDEYHAAAIEEARPMLDELRALIRKELPDAEEVISYGMPAFRRRKVLVYYAANKAHIGFYPTSRPIEAFADALKDFNTSKGAIQFPIGQPIPAELVRQIVQFRAATE